MARTLGNDCCRDTTKRVQNGLHKQGAHAFRDRMGPHSARSSDKIEARGQGQPLRGTLIALLSSLITGKTSRIGRTPDPAEDLLAEIQTMKQCAKPGQHVTLLSLPAEIRSAILEHVFDSNFQAKGFLGQGLLGGIFHNEDYNASSLLAPLLVCKQFYQDSSLLALNRTNFVVSNLFFKIPERIATLHPKQIEAIRSIAFVADARHFRQLHDWGQHPFGIKNLSLDSLTIVLRRSSNWHYLFDFTTDLVHLLRSLTGVKSFTFVRNVALVKGSFKTWYNRLIGLLLKIDHLERYDKVPASPEKTWWTWSYDEVAQSFTLEANPAKRIMDEEAYMQEILPLMAELKVSMENEEWNPDPRSRLPYY
ncbi:hypothetical protein AC579_2192 [Pseudocercospora musae]|uniref:Uncharacterized protein n=1 Tax=Pseudocercospora musae TaxID=113226 RepID=A0A139IKR7_9PEZI|nr:hypothetical protein AC579_2192 [Pseudocercospora musae]